MDSPFSDSTRPAVLSERQTKGDDVPRATRGDVVLVAEFGDAVAGDFAAFVGRTSSDKAVVIDRIPAEVERVDALIVFVGSRLDDGDRRALEETLEVARRGGASFVGIVGSFRVHLDDPEASEVEDHARSLASAWAERVAVFRPGHVLGDHSEAGRLLRRLAPYRPLVAGCLRSCFLEESELFEAIEAERGASLEVDAKASKWAGRSLGHRRREYTLLGSNRAWREVLEDPRWAPPRRSPMTVLCQVLARLWVGHLISFALRVAARRSPRLRAWDVPTLTPRSIRELLSLCHRRNADRVKVVGYNNGVVHFGRRHPGKTVVSTVLCRRLALAGSSLLKADAGATIRGALDFLASTGKELYVVPNYSYVCLGTAFYVPIHGSAIDYSTVLDTIRRVVLYDPETDRIVSARRDDPAFFQNAYDLRSRFVLLRLSVLAKPKSGYFVRHQTLENPTALDLLGALDDRGATNVEIRQAGSNVAKVTVSRYFKDPGDIASPALELPRDALGRLWDQLEENPVTAYLMHAVGRHAVWHEELFFRARDFETFWRTHGQLPLRKLQLRMIRRDGLAHSPFRDEDCISVDLFLIRRHRDRFLEYLRTTLPAVRRNPGKHGS